MADNLFCCTSCGHIQEEPEGESCELCGLFLSDDVWACGHPLPLVALPDGSYEVMGAGQICHEGKPAGV